MRFRFTKMYGSEHDYLVVDAVTQSVFLSSENIKKLADRQKGIGFDRVILVEPPYDPDLDFHFRIFDQQGLELHFSKSASSCFAQFVRAKQLTNKKKILVSVANGKMCLVTNENNEQEVTIELKEPIFDPPAIPFKAKQAEKTYIIKADNYNVLCGVVSICEPCCIVDVEEFNKERITTIGKALNIHERFPTKVKIGFSKINSTKELELICYEHEPKVRSASIFVASAACAIGINQKKLDNNVTVHVAGEHLDISWAGVGSPITMKSFATHVYDGEVEF